MESVQRKFKRMKNLDYVSIDLESPVAMLKMDITNLQFPDNYFDCALVYHVLEHVPEDKKAMTEIYRVLKPGGWAILQVPINRQQTLEVPNVTTPEEREKFFGQRDHVRVYGLDYKDRLETAGLKVTVDSYCRQLGDSLIKKYGLMEKENIYFCRKPEVY
ncbi:MAG: class I SAM-dependent methyltransferase [Dehalococcoidales bacterium]|nr:class I SAM-dependent methyltransferase [Dehalococcoidales bacterium]